MNKAFLYLLLPILILNTSFPEVFKAPKLVSHFIDHQLINQDLGIMEFVSMHYFGNDLNDNDDAEDMKLPFKKIDINGHISHAIPVSRYYTISRLTAYITTVSPPIPQNHTLPNPALNSLFRPPRA